MMPNSYALNETLTSHSASAKSARHSAKEKYLKAILVILSIALIIEIVWLCLIKTSLPLTNIEINGISGIEKDFILRHAGITNQTSYFSVSTSKMESALEELFMVDSAKVIKQFPDTIYIKLNPRIPVVVSLANINGKSIPLFIDKHGVVCKIGDSNSESEVGSSQVDLSTIHASALPIISGLVFGDIRLGMRLPVAFRRMLESIDRININNSILLSSISEIRIQEKLYDGFELVLYLDNSKIKVRMSSEFNEDTLKYIMLMIDVLENTGAEIEELDFRTGIASYKIKEAFNG